jgi:hypothetical protein
MSSKGSRGWVLAGFPVLVLAFGGFGEAQTATRVPVLAELFTSEGCNSCPPADRLLEEFLQEQPIEGVYVVPLSEHVTYWDHQGWKDPFGAQQFTARQQQYGLRFNIDSIYTPQLVIDGTNEYVGSDRRSIERALRSAGRQVKPALKVSGTESNGTLTVVASGPALATEDDAELWVALTEDGLVVDVKRGENANKTLKHSGVVRVLRSAGDAKHATAVTFTVDPAWRRDHLRIVGFVQSRKNKKILGAGFTDTPSR